MIGGLDKGRVLGEFVVTEKIAAGGMGEIYRAVQRSLDREAVVKILPLEDAGDVEKERFLQEAKLASKLEHPYAAHIYAFGAEESDGLLWIAMELVRGVPLDHMIKQRGGLPASMVVPLVEKIAEVLETAHERRIIHRDLKPANVMVVGHAGTMFPKLLDFGIAKLVAAGGETVAANAPIAGRIVSDADTMTVRGSTLTSDSGFEVFGSPRYMPPEQWTNPAAVGPAADIYALGVLTFEALMGRPPFSADTFEDLRHAHETAPVPTIPDVGEAMNATIAKALAKRPEDRHARAIDFARELREAMSEPTASASEPAVEEPAPPPAPAPAPVGKLPPRPIRRAFVLGLIGGATLMVVAVVGVVLAVT
jgi:serine/threonine-protein kinase